MSICSAQQSPGMVPGIEALKMEEGQCNIALTDEFLT